MNTYALVVASASLGADIAGWLSSMGHRVRVVPDFACAKNEVDSDPPCLLVTEVKLGAFNGLHLVVRARGRGLTAPAIVIGDIDCVLMDEARQLDACYAAMPLDQRTFVHMTRSLLEQS